jgi:Mg-chelatase subunit ChlD
MSAAAFTTPDAFLCPITQEVMRDPVIGSDGITYERTAIETWFATGNTTSPMTRAPMSRILTPNIALRGLIQSTAPITSAPAAATTDDPAEVPAPTTPPTLRVQKIAGTGEILVTVSESEDAPTLPVLFIDVLDNSGSMGLPASDNTASEAAAFSRSDLVRHSVNTQIELLRPQDRLAVVLFDHNSQVALPPTANRQAARSILQQISPNGGTNIWGGLFRALQLAEEASATATTTQNVVIILQTDGQSDPTYNPPRGIVPTLRAWLDAHPAVRLTIHTVGYGMGRDLDTPLLREIAETTGGTTNYIPDGSMVGTVFIHMMANLMSCSRQGLTLQIPDAGVTRPIGFLQTDQVREFVFAAPRDTTSFTVSLNDAAGPVASVTVPSTAELPETPPGFPNAVEAALYELRSALAAAERRPDPLLPNPLTALIHRTSALLESDPSNRMASLLTDLSDSDPSRGQIGKAFGSIAAFDRWGRHYIPTVLSSLQNGWAINFKDALSVEVFGGSPAIRELVDRGDAIFTALPPPTSTAMSVHRYGTSPAAAQTSMASVHSSAGPCFLPGSLVKMADGTEKRCDQIQPGDIDIAGYQIECVIKTCVPFADIVRLEGPHRPAGAAPLPADAGFTLWHPVVHEGEWCHPATIGTVERVATDAIYNFVLTRNPLMVDFTASSTEAAERPGCLIVNGLLTCTMGHSFRANAAIDHPYFGAARPGHRHILDDLRAQPGWSTGYITWSNLRVQHDAATGMICGMAPAPVAV